ncbi:MAG: VOC family protein [Antricoccus sp.]
MTNTTIVGIGAVAIGSPDPRRTQQAYRTLFEVADDDPLRCANVAVEVGEGAGIVSVQFAVDEVAAAIRQLGRRGLVFEGDPAGCSVSGISMSVGTAQPDSSDPLELDHLVINTGNVERAVALYGGRLGLDLRLDRSQSWGARQLFFRCGSAIVEVVSRSEDLDADDVLWGLAWRTTQIEVLHARLAAAGISVGELKSGRKPGSTVFTIHDDALVAPTIIISHTPKEAE